MGASRWEKILPTHLIVCVVDDVDEEMEISLLTLQHDGCFDFVFDVVLEELIQSRSITTVYWLRETIEKCDLFIGVLDNDMENCVVHLFNDDSNIT